MTTNLHPVMAMALAPFAPAQQQYRATSGWRRTFLSPNDADQYDRGYALWPLEPPLSQALSAPFAQGWNDADRDDEFRNEQREEDYARR